MIACLCGGTVEAIIALVTLGGFSGLISWLTAKYNKHCCKKNGCCDE